MKKAHWFTLGTLITLAACGAPGEAGDPCTTDADCEEGLECHVHDEHEAEDHGDEEHESAHEDEDAGGICEAHEEE